MKKIRHEEMEENPSAVKTQVVNIDWKQNLMVREFQFGKDSEMFILGLLKEQRQEEIYKEREKQVFW